MAFLQRHRVAPGPACRCFCGLSQRCANSQQISRWNRTATALWTRPCGWRTAAHERQLGSDDPFVALPPVSDADLAIGTFEFQVSKAGRAEADLIIAAESIAQTNTAIGSLPAANLRDDLRRRDHDSVGFGRNLAICRGSGCCRKCQRSSRERRLLHHRTFLIVHLGRRNARTVVIYRCEAKYLKPFARSNVKVTSC